MDDNQKELFKKLVNNGVAEEVAEYIVNDEYVMSWYKEDCTTEYDVIRYIDLAKEVAAKVQGVI